MSRRLVIRAGRVLAGPELIPEADPTVVVEGSSIESLGAPDADLSPGAEEIDATGLTLVPGFIDAHVHIGFFPPADVVHGGVTAVRDLAWPPDQIFPLAERSRATDFEGPTIVAAGPMLTVPGGYPTRAAWAPDGTAAPVTSVAEAVEVIEGVAARGAVVVKVGLDGRAGPTFEESLLAAIVDAAHERALNVTAHIQGVDELEKALDAGVDELAHMLIGAERIPDHVIDDMVTHDVVVVPTMSPRTGEALAVATENLAAFAGAGGRVVYGTDLGDEGPRPGIESTEIRAMNAAGMTPREILASATVDAAAWIGLDDCGVIAPGMAADIVGLRGDPATDLDALWAVELVIRRGRVVRLPG